MFVAQEVAEQLIHTLRRPIELVAGRDGGLADQLRRAGSSVFLNVCEGARRVGRDRLNRYRIAAGSAAEIRAALKVASAWGYLAEESIGLSLTLVDRELALLWGLTHARK